MKLYIFAGLLVLASVAVFVLLSCFLGGYGAMLGALLFSGLVESATERTTNPNE